MGKERLVLVLEVVSDQIQQGIHLKWLLKEDQVGAILDTPTHLHPEGSLGTHVLKPPRHECAGVPLAHPMLPVSSEEKPGSWWG